MTTLTASKLRADIYRILDEIIASGVPVEVERKGVRLRIVPVEQPSKMSRLVRRPDAVNGNPESLVHIDWSSEWRP